MRFENKVAIVVGGAGDMGFEFVKKLHNEGAKVVIGDLAVDRMKEIETELGENVIGVKTDVTVEDDHKNLVSTALEKFGSVDIAINIAGGSKMGLIDEGSVEDWDWTMDLKLKGTYYGMRHQIPAMKQTGGGNIVNVASINAVTPMWGDGAYNVANAGIISLTQTCVLENTEDNIRCNTILPGQIDTKMTKGWRAIPEINDEYMRRIPMHRPGKPEEVANAVMFFASDESSYINGASLIVDGGRACTGYPNIAPFLKLHPELWAV